MWGLVKFALALFVAGGFIAWLGDRLGTYVGKKRISKFGLRPKHTAMLYTIFSGSAIALLTFGLLVATDRKIQRAVVEGDRIVRENRRLMAQNGKLQRQYVDAQEQVLSSGIQARKASADARTAFAAEAKARQQYQSALTLLAKAAKELTKSEQAVKTHQRELEVSERQLARVEQDLTSTGTALRAAKGEVSDKKRQLADARQGLTLAQRNVDLARRSMSVLTAKSRTLTATNRDLEKRNEAIVNNNVIFRKGQEVGRLVVSTAQPVEAIQKQLTDWVAEMSAQVRKYGASATDGSEPLMIDADTSALAGVRVPVTDRDKLSGLAQRIVEQIGVAGSIVVVAQARYNTFVGEPTHISMHPYDNVLLFTKDQKIAVTTVDGSQSDKAILTSLQTFLVRSVRPIAASAGIIPNIDRKTGDKSYGEVMNDWVTLVKQIQQIGPGAVVTVVADTDTYASGPLRLRVVASPAQPGVPVPSVALRGEDGL